VALTNEVFGGRNVGIVYGWIFFAHQVGAAMAAWLGGVAHDATGDYVMAFILAGITAGIGSALATRISKPATLATTPA